MRLGKGGGKSYTMPKGQREALFAAGGRERLIPSKRKLSSSPRTIAGSSSTMRILGMVTPQLASRRRGNQRVKRLPSLLTACQGIAGMVAKCHEDVKCS